MSKLKSNIALLSGALFLLNATLAYYQQKLTHISFDMNTMNEYPINYETYGTAVPLQNKVKIVPKLPNVQGRIFAKERMDTIEWEAQFKIKIDTQKNYVTPDDKIDDLFALWYLITKPY